MDSDSIIKLIIVLFLLLISAFFSSAETALTTANRVRLRVLKEDGNKRAATALHVLDKYGSMLSCILIGNNLVNLFASSLATTIAISININIAVATLILTAVVLIFCETLPKNISSKMAEKMALRYAGVINVLMKILTPVIFIVNGISTCVMKLFKLDQINEDTITEDELRTYVDEGHKDGAIETDEKEMIINVFEFGDSVAKDIMIPRADMITIDENKSLDDIMSLFREHMYTRMPVFDEEGDNIIGFLNIKDIIRLDDSSKFELKTIMRRPFFTIEFRKTADLLNDMRKEKTSMAFVLNEYGTCEGMITIEDLLEEIVGEIRDEYDADEENLIQKMEENTYSIEGSMKLDDINDELGTNLHSDDYDSIGGLLIEHLEDRAPEDGDTIITDDGIKLMVHGLENNRILKVIMTIEPKEEESVDEEV